MKNLKYTLGMLIFLGLAVSSCVDEASKKAEAEAQQAEMELKAEMRKDSIEAEKTARLEREMVANNRTTINGISYVRSMDNEVKALQISGWDGFNSLSIEMKKLEGADMMTMKSTLTSLAKTIAAVKTTRPEWMMTEEISEDIKDLEKEYNEFLKEKNAKEKEVIENMEEINEAYADLVEEINETFDKYVKINRKANEEYNEEMQDDGDTDDAIEEYNEEIKKLDKVADDRKK
ncbi:hypothetical protein N7U66_09335 [Lacinutrix neustonica]|uniref:Uncharacterized protein n=1 Tax=Lacinutrix neustonica TaxID=2980107 RepID=A0A9E8SIF8_9FLAO|nr:hypothetical protein [Lacinutrix neustonica]WAC03635.1 hypothetical protein N7U66_09335 [Lacinutrix neustonica]